MSPAQDIERWLSALGSPGADRDYRPGHERVRRLLDALSLARPRLRVRIAGTNGKGSTAHMLAAALRSQGHRVGLYTSPHIRRFNERIRMNGAPVGDAMLRRLAERILPRARQCGASYFEAATAMALAAFSEMRADVEILEAGVGARLDATTAVPADLALITPIGLDHQAWLGDSLAAIAKEKAHAFRGCRWKISAPQPEEVRAVLRRHAPDLIVARLWPENEPLASSGMFQRVNAGLAWSACECLAEAGFVPDRERARRAIAATEVPGRFARHFLGRTEIRLDPAHNRHAVEALLPDIRACAPWDAILVHPRADRSLDDCLSLLAPFARRLITREDEPDPAAALEHALSRACGGRVLAIGSFVSLGAWTALIDRMQSAEDVRA